MNDSFGKILVLTQMALGGLLASCASTQTSASSKALANNPQQALAARTQSDALLRAGLPLARLDAEADQACASIPAAEQNVCPVQRTTVLGARELRTPLDPKGYLTSSAGAVVYLLAAPGLTSEWLGHLVECYQARTAEAGNALQARESCPLAEPESSYAISSTRNGFAVSIRSPHSEAAKRIFEVSQRLAPSNTPAPTALLVRR